MWLVDDLTGSRKHQSNFLIQTEKTLIATITNATLALTHDHTKKMARAVVRCTVNFTAFVFVLGVGVLLTCTSCNRPTDDTIAKKVAALEAKVETLEKRNSDLALKGQVVSSLLFRSPLEDFFASPEFWEKTYDSGQADCAKRCISTLTTEKKACENIADPTKRQQCFEDARARASNCQTQCSASHPPPIIP